MEKKPQKRALTGWLLIDKPLGVSSAFVVNKARWALGARKAGHAGTLDPLASGLLPIAFGEATKTIPHVQDGHKTYHFQVAFGASTTTDDAEGTIIETNALRPSDARIEAALSAFVGDILQVPPQFSAVKIDGQRAYARARTGEQFSLAARPLRVHALRLLERIDTDHAAFELICGKGGYVRAIARDLGVALGCLGHVVALRRVAVGGFRIEDAMRFDALEHCRPEPPPMLLPLETGLARLPCFAVDADGAEHLRHGRAIVPLGGADEGGDAALCQAWAAYDGKAVALVRLDQDGRIHPTRVFATTD